jgi:hypothetical protein
MTLRAVAYPELDSMNGYDIIEPEKKENEQKLTGI